MANKTVSLMWYCKTPAGWRRFPVIYRKNGRVVAGVVEVDGREVKYPDGRFQLRYYDGAKTVYENAGVNGLEAVAMRDRKERELAARHSASQAGIKILETPGRMVVRTAAGKFIKRTVDSGATEAAEVYRKSLDYFLAAGLVDYVDEIDADVMLAYHAALRKRGHSDRTVANRHSHIVSFLKWAGVDTAALKLRKPRYEKKLPTVYSRDELSTLLASNDDQYLGVVLDVLRMTGLRESEAVHLQWQDIDFRRGLVLVRSKPEMGFRIKDAEERDVVMPDALAAVLKEWRKQRPKSSKLVLGTVDDQPQRHWLRLLKRLARRAGLNCNRCPTCLKRKECSRWTLHSFRRTYAVMLLRNGVDVRTLMQQLGHSDLQTTLKYIAPLETEATARLVKAIEW